MNINELKVLSKAITTNTTITDTLRFNKAGGQIIIHIDNEGTIQKIEYKIVDNLK